MFSGVHLTSTECKSLFIIFIRLNMHKPAMGSCRHGNEPSGIIKALNFLIGLATIRFTFTVFWRMMTCSFVGMPLIHS